MNIMEYAAALNAGDSIDDLRAQRDEAEHRVCDGCGYSYSAKWLKEHGKVSCCPERKMLTAKEWATRANAAERERDALRERVAALEYDIPNKWQAVQDELWERLAEAETVIRPFADAVKIEGAWVRIAAPVSTADCERAAAYFAKHGAPSPPDGEG